MTFGISPGVTFTETDLTTYIPTAVLSPGAYVGIFEWGPASYPTLIADATTLVNTFGQPGTNSAVSFFSVFNFIAYGGQMQVVRAIANTTNNATTNGTGLQIPNPQIWHQEWSTGAGSVGTWAARFPGYLGNTLFVSQCPSANAWSSNISAQGGIYANTTANSTLVSFSNATFAPQNTIPYGLKAGDLLNIGTFGGALVLNVSSNGTQALVNTNYTATLIANNAVRNWAYTRFFTGAPGTSEAVAAENGSGDEMHVIVIDQNGWFTGTANAVLETYPFVSKAYDATNDDGSTNYLPTVIYNKSGYIYWMDFLAAGTNWGNTGGNTAFTSVPFDEYVTLSGGLTGTVTDGNIISGWNYFVDPTQINIGLIVTGNYDPTVSLYVLENIAGTRRDCVAFISPQQTDVVNVPGFEVTNVINTRNNYPSTSYGFMTCNWKYQYDQYNNIYRWLPDNADIAGLCARTDITNAPWWSPAGFNRGGLLNTIKFAWNPTGAQRDQLYPNSINPDLVINGQGPVLYGDKTLLTKPSAFSRINVRRLFITLEKAISLAAQYSLFEFNDAFTQAQFVNMVDPYLRQVQGQRGITAYQVVCDSTNNTAEVVQNNQFIGDIYIQPAYSINYIQLNFVAVGPTVTFSEIVGQSGIL